MRKRAVPTALKAHIVVTHRHVSSRDPEQRSAPSIALPHPAPEASVRDKGHRSGKTGVSTPGARATVCFQGKWETT